MYLLLSYRKKKCVYMCTCTCAFKGVCGGAPALSHFKRLLRRTETSQAAAPRPFYFHHLLQNSFIREAEGAHLSQALELLRRMSVNMLSYASLKIHSGTLPLSDVHRYHKAKRSSRNWEMTGFPVNIGMGRNRERLIHSEPVVASRFAVSRTDRSEHEASFLGKSQEGGKQTAVSPQVDSRQRCQCTRQGSPLYSFILIIRSAHDQLWFCGAGQNVLLVLWRGSNAAILSWPDWELNLFWGKGQRV